MTGFKLVLPIDEDLQDCANKIDYQIIFLTVALNI